ncbi:MAG: DUF1592 domain-containing protein [Polyangiaceae bacterium]|nr:DUF1592 domain-containing protein [Polyangiaceae bacterium]
MRLFQTSLLVLGLPLLGAACTGGVAGTDGSRAGTPGAPTDSTGMPGVPTGMPSTSPTGTSTIPVVPVQLPAAGALGPIALRRLNKWEYDNTVQRLGAAPGASSAFAEDDPSLGYNNMAAALTVTPLLAEQYARAAKALAAGLNLVQEAPCADGAAGAAETACATAFIEQFGKRSFRRPLTGEEITAYTAIFQEKRARGDYAGGIRLVAETMLQSPHFLYKTEIGEGSGVDRALTAYELASQISYLALGGPPDDELLAAAQGAKLSSPAEREVQLRRLLTKPESTPWVASFVTRWLGIAEAGYLAKDQTAFPSYTPSLSVAVAEESQRFIADLFAQSNGSLETLFTANFTLSNAELGAHYGLGQVPTAWEKVTLPAGQRLGVLTQPAFLVATSKSADSFPIRRGKTLRTRILCGDVPPPPPNLEIMPVELNPNLTTRERFVQHQQAGSVCASCHSLIDPLGFGFENYDATGAYRTTENNKPIDASGEIKAIAPEIDGPFANALEFTQRIAPSQVLKACVARESLRWSLGRATLDTPPTDPKVLRDQAIIQGLAARLGMANSDIRELLVAVVLRDEYGFRSDQ